MDRSLFNSYIIAERSYLSYIKREIHNLVKPHFTGQRTGEIDIVVSEMTSNLIKYAGKGELLYRMSHEGETPVFEVICLDNGPGIMSLPHSMMDGVSSKSTLGHGLGSIKRLSNLFQIYSLPSWGTVLYSLFYPSADKKAPKTDILVRCLNLAKPGEKVSGDGAHVRFLKDRTLVLAGDGLGHGEHAREAVEAAIRVFNESISADPSEIIRELHVGVKKTRGLVATVAVLDHKAKIWEVCGVGNIHTRLNRGLEYKNYVCNNGIIGLNIPARLENAKFEMSRLQQFIFCSDGIKTKWEMSRYPGILKYDPMILAAVLYKDHARLTDDMTILITKLL